MSVNELRSDEEWEKLSIRVERMGPMRHPKPVFVLRTDRGWMLGYSESVEPLMYLVSNHWDAKRRAANCAS